MKELSLEQMEQIEGGGGGFGEGCLFGAMAGFLVGGLGGALVGCAVMGTLEAL